MNVIAPEDLTWVTPLERGVKKGERVAVSAALGNQLVEQGWRPSKKTAPAKKAAPKAETPAGTDEETS
jgi:hypothetical protein